MLQNEIQLMLQAIVEDKKNLKKFYKKGYFSYLNKEDYNLTLKFIDTTIKAYYEYQNSVFGIIESLNKEYQQMSFDASEIQEKLSDPENLTLLKDVLNKLG